MNNSHWITCKIDLEKWKIFIYDSFAHHKVDDHKFMEDAIIPLRAFLPVIMKQAGYFDHLVVFSRSDIFRAVRLPPENIAKQDDNNSCGMFSLTFMEYILLKVSLFVSHLDSKIFTSFIEKKKLRKFLLTG